MSDNSGCGVVAMSHHKVCLDDCYIQRNKAFAIDLCEDTMEGRRNTLPCLTLFRNCEFSNNADGIRSSDCTAVSSDSTGDAGGVLCVQASGCVGDPSTLQQIKRLCTISTQPKSLKKLNVNISPKPQVDITTPGSAVNDASDSSNATTFGIVSSAGQDPSSICIREPPVM